MHQLARVVDVVQAEHVRRARGRRSRAPAAVPVGRRRASRRGRPRRAPPGPAASHWPYRRHPGPPPSRRRRPPRRRARASRPRPTRRPAPAPSPCRSARAGSAAGPPRAPRPWCPAYSNARPVASDDDRHRVGDQRVAARRLAGGLHDVADRPARVVADRAAVGVGVEERVAPVLVTGTAGQQRPLAGSGRGTATAAPSTSIRTCGLNTPRGPRAVRQVEPLRARPSGRARPSRSPATRRSTGTQGARGGTRRRVTCRARRALSRRRGPCRRVRSSARPERHGPSEPDAARVRQSVSVWTRRSRGPRWGRAQRPAAGEPPPPATTHPARRTAPR